MAHFSKRNRRREKETQQALNNRLELVKEGFTRRDLIKMGLMTGAGVLIPKVGVDPRLRTGSIGSIIVVVRCYHGSSCDVGCSPQPAQVLWTRCLFRRSCPTRPLTDPGLTVRRATTAIPLQHD